MPYIVAGLVAACIILALATYEAYARISWLASINERKHAEAERRLRILEIELTNLLAADFDRQLSSERSEV